MNRLFETKIKELIYLYLPRFLFTGFILLGVSLSIINVITWKYGNLFQSSQNELANYYYLFIIEILPYSLIVLYFTFQFNHLRKLRWVLKNYMQTPKKVEDFLQAKVDYLKTISLRFISLRNKLALKTYKEALMFLTNDEFFK